MKIHVNEKTIINENVNERELKRGSDNPYRLTVQNIVSFERVCKHRFARELTRIIRANWAKRIVFLAVGLI